MKVFISDVFLNNQNVYGKNGEMINFVNTLNEKVTIIFISDVTTSMSIHEYLETLSDFHYFHWKRHFEYLEIHDIYLCNESYVKTILNGVSSSEIYQFTKNSKVVFHEINIENLFPLFKENSMKNEKKHIFIHLLNRDYNQLDKIIIALSKIREKVHITFYNPVHEYINRKVKLSEFTIDNNSLIYKIRNESISFALPENFDELDKTMEVDIKVKLSREEDLYVNNDNYRLLFDLYCHNYDIIEDYFEKDIELYKKIYNADMYIPISNEFCILSILSQKYKTYTLFLNDSDMNQEYCMYGKVVTQMTKDVCYNIIEKKLEKVLKVEEIVTAVNEYFENENNPMFQYTKEIADVLY